MSRWDAIGDYAHVSGVATEQTISTRESILHRIIVASTAAGQTTVLVEDGAATEICTLTLNQNDERTLEFGCRVPNGIRVTPSDAGINMAIIYEEM